MFKSKGLIIGAAVAVVAGVMLVGGLAVTNTQGAGTDTGYVGPGPSGPLTSTGNTTTPPQSPVENPAIPGTGTEITGATTTGVNADGSVAGNNGAPGTIGALPNAGFGPDGGNGGSGLLLALAAAGLALVVAGSTVVATGRRD